MRRTTREHGPVKLAFYCLTFEFVTTANAPYTRGSPLVLEALVRAGCPGALHQATLDGSVLASWRVHCP